MGDIKLNVVVEKNIMVPMRDGVRLATDVTRPDPGGAVPAVLIRTPYSKDNDQGVSMGCTPTLMQFVEAGYAVVVQDVRGTFKSEGSFGDFRGETPDGEDTLAWLGNQSWCDGNVGMAGASYLAKTQFAAAKSSAPALKAMVPIVGVHDAYRLGWFRDGVPYGYIYGFGLMMAVSAAMRAASLGEESNLEALLQAMTEMDVASLPFSDRPELENFTWWRNIVDHPDRDGQWREEALEDPSAVRAPAFQICGWYDTGNPSFCDLFELLGSGAGSAEARTGQRIIVGPWTHGDSTGSFPGRSFGPAASAEAAGVPAQVMRFYDRWLKGDPHALDDDPPIRLFVMGIDEWRDYIEWPIPNTKLTDFFLSSGGAANTAQGDGVLVTDPPGAEPDDVFLYNPRRPTPTALLEADNPGLRGTHLPAPIDQREVESREDVLCYTTPVLGDAVEVIGRMSLRLFVSSSAPDTDFVAKLVDVFPDGRAIFLTDGICRTRYRSSFSEPELMDPGKIYELSVDLAATANVFLPGHRIRVEISSSNFPRYVRNTNTGGNIIGEGDDDLVVATNRVLHNSSYPSRLSLPVVNAS